jgi:hypothetical protein
MSTGSRLGPWDWIGCFPTADLAVPGNFKLIAVPLYDLFENAKRYGQQLSKIPECISRFNFDLIEPEGDLEAPKGDDSHMETVSE